MFLLKAFQVIEQQNFTFNNNNLHSEYIRKYVLTKK